MPIDEELMNTARTIHDEMMACGMISEAAAIRHAVNVAVIEQDEEERFGTERLSDCLNAVKTLQEDLYTLSEKRPITAGDISRVLKHSIPQIELMVYAENGPVWLRNVVAPINEAVRRLVSQLQSENAEGTMTPGGQVRFADCVASLGTYRAGESVTPEQT